MKRERERERESDNGDIHTERERGWQTDRGGKEVTQRVYVCHRERGGTREREREREYVCVCM